MKVLTPEEVAALSPEDREAVIINTHAQMILDLMKAAKMPVSLRTLAALQLCMETVAQILEESMSEEDLKKLASTKEIYLAHNMGDAVKGGTAKKIITG